MDSSGSNSTDLVMSEYLGFSVMVQDEYEISFIKTHLLTRLFKPGCAASQSEVML